MRLILLAMGLFSLVGIVVSSKKVAGNVPSVSIIGGKPAALGELPYLAALNLDGRVCTGSLISTTHVLTAASCLDSSQSFASKYTVYLNTLKYDGTTSGAITRKVKKFIRHPKYDIGVLVLSAAVTNVKPIPLPPSIPIPTTKPTTTTPTTTNTIPTTITTPSYGCTCIPITPAPIPSGYANTNAVIAGWGQTNASVELNSKVLLKANVTIQDDSFCTRQYGEEFFVGYELCASAPGKSTCGGDRGGPIIVKGVLVGTASWAYGCANPDYAGIYTRITTYVAWIKTTMANNVG
ncbi:trypsin Blo t 3-like isoform X2 [Daphnia pulicaria]|uniref:trypsin Blo t 3-like isoform X2 n=1 Tax=Daphnia pulicaria TaxID=35523 RepID=UPI001EEB2C78|nr:trypsin Blo t 3-like isoform X2 [Daphnia pulicaria]